MEPEPRRWPESKRTWPKSQEEREAVARARGEGVPCPMCGGAPRDFDAAQFQCQFCGCEYRYAGSDLWVLGEAGTWLGFE